MLCEGAQGAQGCSCSLFISHGGLGNGSHGQLRRRVGPDRRCAESPLKDGLTGCAWTERMSSGALRSCDHHAMCRIAALQPEARERSNLNAFTGLAL